MLTAFRQELAEAGNDSIAQLTRFYLHLDDATLQSFIEDFLTLAERYREGDERREKAGSLSTQESWHSPAHRHDAGPGRMTHPRPHTS